MTQFDPTATPEPVAPPPPAAPAPPPVVDRPETFSREYVEELRRENAEYRTKLSPYEELFDGFDDDTRGSVEQLIQLAKTGDPAAVDQVAELFGLEKPQGPQYLTADAAERIADQKLEVFRQEQAVQQIYHQAETLGYQEDSDEMVLFLRALNAQPDGQMDYKAADESVKTYQQKIISDYVAKKGSQGSVPTQPEGTPAASPVDTNTPKTMAQAREAAQARIRATHAAR